MERLTPVLAISMVLAACVTVGDEAYDEPLVATDGFRIAFDTEDWESAYLVIRPSESSPNPHPVDLMFLASMYVDEDFPNLGTKRERALKYWDLSERAAQTGYEPAVIELSHAFLWGDVSLGYESDREVADCLDDIIAKRAYVSSDTNWLDQQMVKDCLLIAEPRSTGIPSESSFPQ